MKAHESVNLPQFVEVWPQGKVPLAGTEDADFPRLTSYLPSEECRSGASMLILPGGGYSLVSTAKEGHRPAQLLASHGVAAGVLEYRHSPQRHPVPLIDAQRGLRLLRSFALKHGLDPDRVGVMGFSAGGHLAGTLATQPEVEAGRIGDELDSISCRPDFAALIYPVVSLVEDFSHIGSRNNLLGEPADPELASQLSVERAVSPGTCPMFIVHAQDDGGVPVQNSLALTEALTRHGVPAELHVYPKGGHGFGLAANHDWGRVLLRWLSGAGRP